MAKAKLILYFQQNLFDASGA